MKNEISKKAFYHIYPLGFCGAPKQNDFSEPVNRIEKISDFVPHIKKMGFNAVYLGPVFSSSAHGYDTADYYTLDNRLGTNEDFALVCRNLHNHGIDVVLDGVFNHVGRDFWAFRDVKEHKWDSRYKDWFHIDFGGNSGYNDGFWYDGWEGHYELVRLNLSNHEVKQHIFDAVKNWKENYNIDGLRLDVAYCLDKQFLRELSGFCRSIDMDFWILGEMLHGDYKTCVNSEMIDSATNYECYKGLHSSFNSMNMFEIAHSIKRQFGKEDWCLYRGLHLYTFVDNHDVSRIATILNRQEHLPLIYTLMYAMPSIPSVYYGSEWGISGDKHRGDDDLRPCLTLQGDTDLTKHIMNLNKAYASSTALGDGDYTELVLTNTAYIFQRQNADERIIVCINISENEYTAHYNAGCGMGVDLLTGKNVDFGGGTTIPPYTSMIIKCER